MSDGAILSAILVSGAVSGAICAWVASEKGRSGISWFFLGFLFNFFAIIALAAVPSNQKNIASETTPLEPLAVPTTFTNNFTKTIKPSVERDINKDSYKLYLTEKYKVTRNELFGKYVYENNLYSTLEELFPILDELDRINEANFASAESCFRNQKFESFQMRGYTCYLFSNGELGIRFKEKIRVYDNKELLTNAFAAWEKTGYFPETREFQT